MVWHQDASFLYTEPQSVVGLWFALDNGCLWVEPGAAYSPLNWLQRAPDFPARGFA